MSSPLGDVHLTHESAAPLTLTPPHATRDETEAFRRARRRSVDAWKGSLSVHF
jgi:hypothetical protein